MQHGLLAELGSLRAVVSISFCEESLGIGCRGDSSQLPGELFLPCSGGISDCTIGFCSRYCWSVWGRWRHATFVVMAQRWGTLVGKVGIGVGRGRDGVVERVAFAGDRLRAIAGDVRHKPRLAEARLFILGGRGGVIGLVGDVAGVVAAVDSEEVLDALRDVAVGAV